MRWGFIALLVATAAYADDHDGNPSKPKFGTELTDANKKLEQLPPFHERMGPLGEALKAYIRRTYGIVITEPVSKVK